MIKATKFNNQILKIWQDHPSFRGKYCPLLYPDFRENSILFVGCNPSFSKDFLKKLNKVESDFLYEESQIENKVNKIIECEQISKSQYPYFNRFKKIGEKTGLNWEHLDLFFFRQTSQNNFKKVIGFDNSFGINEFGKDQLKIAFEVIYTIQPKMIVVANAFASDIIYNINKFNLGIDIELNKCCENVGYDILKIKGKKFYTLLCSMLTGQRALDKYSYTRLIWQIKEVLKNDKSNNL